MFEITIPEKAQQPLADEAKETDPYGGVALGVECAWPAASDAAPLPI
jgi:hypothetical protein